MKIPSGKIDQSIAFVAVDVTDLKTREAGLSGFTVYRSRNGAAPVLYTTPTVVEARATNMPGVYWLLIDEDTTMAASSDTEEYTVHITHASMSPVTRAIELYRPPVTVGETITVSGGAISATTAVTNGVTIATGGLSNLSFAAGAIDAAACAQDFIGSSEFSQSAADKVFGSGGAALSELAQGVPAATPTPREAIMLLYMALRNASQSTGTERRIKNDAGTVIAKATMSDDGTTFDQGELVGGP